MNSESKKSTPRRPLLPGLDVAEYAVKKLTLTETILFFLLTATLFISSFFLLVKVNDSFLIEIPSKGGSLVEGVIGSPRFINPLLATSDADRDLSSLIYSGLLKATTEGDLVPDLAEEYKVSENGLEYSFILKEDLTFHDGKPVTADDIIFTVSRAQDPALKSPKRANWDGVTAEKISDREVKLILRQAYSPFLENTTVGILPRHIWKDAEPEQFAFSQFNIEPIGSGPYKVDKIKRNGSGVPIYYDLKSFGNYALGAPYIDHLIMQFYTNDKLLSTAFERGDVEAINSISPKRADELKKSGKRVEKSPLPRIFGVFFNQNQAPLFANKEVRQALDVAVDKQQVVNQVLNGYGTPINGPIPTGRFESVTAPVSLSQEERLAKAREILEKAKWTWNEEKKVMEFKGKKSTTELRFSIATSNTPELKQSAELIKEMWEKMGAQVELKIFEPGDLNQNVIRTRKYDALLFGEIIGRDLDLFAFWHSSQRNDPGLNIALYTNAKVDKLLEEARTLSAREDRMERFMKFDEEIRKDIPAVFTYSPDFIYILPHRVKGFALGHVTVPGERFLNVHEWHIATDKVWKIFAKNTNN